MKYLDWVLLLVKTSQEPARKLTEKLEDNILECSRVRCFVDATMVASSFPRSLADAAFGRRIKEETLTNFLSFGLFASGVAGEIEKAFFFSEPYPGKQNEALHYIFLSFARALFLSPTSSPPPNWVPWFSCRECFHLPISGPRKRYNSCISK